MKFTFVALLLPQGSGDTDAAKRALQEALARAGIPGWSGGIGATIADIPEGFGYVAKAVTDASGEIMALIEQDGWPRLPQ
jgi:hypothetical protein